MTSSCRRSPTPRTAKAEELGAELTIVSADEDTATQLGQVENFITDEMDAIIVIPVDTDAAGPMTAAAQAAGIPLVYVNRRPSDLPTDGSVPYVGSDSLYAGTVEMQMLSDLAGGEGNVVILIGDPANEAAVLRTQGCHDVIDANPGLTFVAEQSGHWYPRGRPQLSRRTGSSRARSSTSSAPTTMRWPSAPSRR